MTGSEALVALVVRGRRVRNKWWPAGEYIQVVENRVIDESGATFDILEESWGADDGWSIVEEVCSFDELFDKLGPGKHATSDAFPNFNFRLFTDDGYLKVSYLNETNVGIQKDMLTATYKIHEEDNQ